MNSQSRTERLKEFVRKHGLVRPRDVEKAGLPTRLLYRLRDRGELIEEASGLFRHPDLRITEKHTYAEAAKLVPRGVVCLLSALDFHEFTTQLPGLVWMALDRENRREPSPNGPPMEFVWFSGDAFTAGQETHEIEGVAVTVYSPAKTVADLFKYRRKLGLDVALEALQEGWSEQLFTMEELQRYGRICRVQSVMKPHLQSLSSRR